MNKKLKTFNKVKRYKTRVFQSNKFSHNKLKRKEDKYEFMKNLSCSIFAFNYIEKTNLYYKVQ